MKKRILILCVVLIGLSGSAALAVSPMGPPTAGLNAGQMRLGYEYAWGETDLGLDGMGLSGTLSDVETNTHFANLGYGINDDWEVYLKLGVANGEMDEFDGDYGFAYGFGTKLTFAKDDTL